MTDTELDPVWRALSSPHRRHILDLLRDAPRTTTQVGEGMPALSRFAVMQHLDVLEEAGLVLVRREGRTRLNYLNPVLLRALYERWVQEHARPAAEAVLRLKDYLEYGLPRRMQLDQAAHRVVKIEMEVPIQATVEAAFTALTTGMNEWWPHRFKPDGQVVFEPFVGGRIMEQWPDGTGALYGVLTWYEPNKKFASSGPSALLSSFASTSVETVEGTNEGCVYRKSMTIWGDVPDEVERMFREGSRAIMERALKVYLEAGTGYSAPSS